MLTITPATTPRMGKRELRVITGIASHASVGSLGAAAQRDRSADHQAAADPRAEHQELGPGDARHEQIGGAEAKRGRDQEQRGPPSQPGPHGDQGDRQDREAPAA